MLSVALLSVVAMCSCETFHIVPVNSTERCEEEACLTLDQLARKVANHNFSNLTLHLLPGDHFLHKNMDIFNAVHAKLSGCFSNTTVWLQGATMNISGVEVFVAENIIFSSSGWSGKVFVSKYGEFSLNKCTFNRVKLKVASKSETLFYCTFDKINVHRVLNFSNDWFTIPCKFNDSIRYISSYDIHFAFQVSNNTNGLQEELGIIIGANSGHTYITNCEFKETYSGAIEVLKADRIKIINSTFNNNYYTVRYKGSGSISELRSNHFLMDNCTFTHNFNCGTVLEVSAHNLDITNSKFIDNECMSSTIQVGYLKQNDTNSILINGSTFINNHGWFSAGVLSSGILVVTNCQFIANSAYLGAAAIASKHEMSISSSTFTNNSGLNGAVTTLKKSFKIINCIFTNANERGKAISTLLYGKLPSKISVIKDTVFIKNFNPETVTLYGAIVKIENTSFINNGKQTLNNGTKNRISGCIHSFNSRVYITGPVTFSGNIGSAIYAIQSHIYINSTEKIVIKNNTAYIGGGLMLLESELVIQSPVIISNNYWWRNLCCSKFD